MEVKGSSRGTHRQHFKSIKDLDEALIKKLAIITGVVIAADIVCVAFYVLLKKYVQANNSIAIAMSFHLSNFITSIFSTKN